MSDSKRNTSLTADHVSATHLGRFSLLEKAGAGAMGVVYAAYDPSLDRRVAVKVLHGRTRPGYTVDRIRHEAMAMARLRHPNIAAVHEVGDADGQLFIAMEYIDGPTLQAWLQAEDCTWQAALTLFVQLGSGLAAAHAEGLVHRDFKPANVLIGRDDRPIIIDFGLARPIAADVPAVEPMHSGEFARLSGAVSQAGRLKGTPAYMAPELLDGKVPSAASDQFAFCVALYEALVGSAPFPRDSLPILRHAIERGHLSDPGRAGVPSDVINVVRRGLAARPADRWPSMEALVRALTQAGQVEMQLARGWRTRMRVYALILGLLVLLQARNFITGPPDTPERLLGSGAAVSLFLGAICVYSRRWFRLAEVNRRLGHLLVGLLVLKPVTLAFGIALGMSVTQLFGMDILVSSGLVWIGAAYLGADLRLPILFVAGLVLIGSIRPQYTPQLHGLAMAAYILGLMRAEWILRAQLTHRT